MTPQPAVRLIIEDDKGRVLLIRRDSTDYGQGAWCLPGGKVDYGETVEHAVSKELREETSLECTSARFLFYQDSLPLEEGRMHCINFYFACEVAGELVLNEESSELRWVSPSEMEELDVVFRNDEGLRRYWGGRAAGG